MRQFKSGATRDNEESKLDYEGFLSPIVLERYAQYMHKHRVQADGKLRDSDNWQKGMPLEAYMKSGWRHFMDWWKEHRDLESRDGIEDAICGLLFNAMGYLYELLNVPPVFDEGKEAVKWLHNEDEWEEVKLTPKEKKVLDAAIKKVIDEYGEALRKLGKE